MSKQLLAILALALVLGAGVFAFYWQNRQQEVTTPLPMPPVVEVSEEPTVSYSQHIEAIPGNTDEVWYNIPEYGVRMKLNKAFAGELIYSDGMVDDFGESQEGIYFSTRAISEAAPECAPRRGGAFGVLFKSKGNMREQVAVDEYLAPRASDYTQIGEYYYGWTGPQALCEFGSHQGVLQKNWPKDFPGLGAKSIPEGMQTLELISQK